MSAGKTRLERWEARLKKVFDEIDTELELRYGHRARRHPNRPPHGATSNREHDGLFDLGAAFTVGIGSQYGPGYVVQARIATLTAIPPAIQQELEDMVARRLREKLPAAFPGHTLHVDRDGPIYKIHGDLSLGTL
ncbi:MAG TPA: hypothetical protein PLT37_06655 [Kiritimatiellia bacterium]|nr:hypothetical protein [Kiritimatiellia bacterium]MBP9572587.1 hypothetical protein [Kiritimatiellia bacterium]HQF20905.1 hypothetical protein [Kiritimatiellia bacterium]HQG75334.1 hypothetical protein [Kiritimatiellia bacterium]HXK79587.1 hypothetical protein [Kiritimatiellia bacterium]